MRILYIEDEAKVANLVKKALAEEGFEVDTADDGLVGYEMAHSGVYQLLIIDHLLPNMMGREICQKLRYESYTFPILFLSALSSIDDTVSGLNSGADDYLTKPFALAELLARIQALTRRLSPSNMELKVENLVLNQVTHDVHRGGRLIPLSSREYRLLEYMMRHPDQVHSRVMIMQNVWDMDFDPETNIVEVYINYLRSKINQPGERKLISTVRGIGYRIV
jgi:two-component system OmpR family response regulator